MQQILVRCWRCSSNKNGKFLVNVILDSCETERENKQISDISGGEKCEEAE